MLHPAPRSALFLGLGSGVTAASAVQPGLRVHAVELLPQVLRASPYFVPALANPGQGEAPAVTIADARRHVRASTARHDVIVADLFHPARSGAAALFTQEHFAAVRERLAPRGVFCQWLPLHQLDLHSLRSIAAAFLAVYPDAIMVLATHSLDTPVLGLVARSTGGAWDPEALRARHMALTGGPEGGVLASLQLDDEWSLPGSVLADAGALRAFVGTTPANRDTHPVLAHLAPRLAQDSRDGPRHRLGELLALLEADPATVFGNARDAAGEAWRHRLSAYWRARDHYLAAGMRVRLSPDVRATLAQVRTPLLEALQLSPDFRAAYDPLLRMAAALYRHDPDAARELLAQVQRAHPARTDAADLLRRLETPSP